jgi:hypothetical protein
MDALRSGYNTWYTLQFVKFLTLTNGRRANQLDVKSLHGLQVMVDEIFEKTTELLLSPLTELDKKRILERLTSSFIDQYKEKSPKTKEVMERVMRASLLVSDKERIPFIDKAATLMAGDADFFCTKLEDYQLKCEKAKTLAEVKRYEDKHAQMVFFIQQSKLSEKEKEAIINGTYNIVNEESDFSVFNAPLPNQLFPVPAAAQKPAAADDFLDDSVLDLNAPLPQDVVRQHNFNAGMLPPAAAGQQRGTEKIVPFAGFAYVTFITRIHDIYLGNNQNIIEISKLLVEILENKELTQKEKSFLVLKINETDFTYALSLLDDVDRVDRLMALYTDGKAVPQKEDVNVGALKVNPYYQSLYDLYLQLILCKDPDLQLSIQIDIITLRDQISEAVMDPQEKKKLQELDFEKIVRKSMKR